MSRSHGRHFGVAINSVLAVVWAAVYIYLGTTSAPPSVPVGGRVDLVAHLGASFVLAVLVADALPGRRTWRWVMAAAASVAVGLAIEAFQTRIPARSFEWWDVAADAVGAAIGAIAHRSVAGSWSPQTVSIRVAVVGAAAIGLAALMLLVS